MTKISAIDLFCGVGGLTHGLQKAGVQVTCGVDLDAHSRFAYEANNKAQFIHKDVSTVTGAELRPFFEKAPLKLLAGCAPCQPFSKYNRDGLTSKNKTKWSLLSEFSRLVEECQPDFITMENVPRLVRTPIFEFFLKSLGSYHVWYKILDCADGIVLEIVNQVAIYRIGTEADVSAAFELVMSQ